MRSVRARSARTVIPLAALERRRPRLDLLPARGFFRSSRSADQRHAVDAVESVSRCQYRAPHRPWKAAAYARACRRWSQRVGECGGDDGNAGLADAAGALGAGVENAHVHVGHLVHAHDGVLVEVALFDAAFLEGDGAGERGGKTEADRRFELHRYDVRVHGEAAVDRAIHLLELEAAAACALLRRPARRRSRMLHARRRPGSALRRAASSQPASDATASSAARWRGCFVSSERRNCTGSALMARAMSSRKHSVANAV